MINLILLLGITFWLGDIILNIKNNKSKMFYTIKHKKAYLMVEKDLSGKNTLKGYLHDVDKLFLYLFFSVDSVRRIHRWWSRHHTESFWSKNLKDYEQMVIDWECARYTKPDKPLTAREMMCKVYPELMFELVPILRKYKL
jgi:AAA+ ATPase superfamily predicted ATPase